MQSHSNTVKPYLTDQNKRDRVKFALSFVRGDVSSLPFRTMFDYVHLDEKWFYMTRIKENYDMVQGEKPPARKVKSKRFIMKVMFLCAVARPRYDHHRKSYFDGKIGLWPFVEHVPVKSSSRNRPAGTLQTKPITVTQDVCRSFSLGMVFPAIMNKWPAYKHHPVYVQEDNARHHVPSHDQEMREKGREDGWNIVLCNQPANSPDFNVLDLGFFNAIHSLQHQAAAENIGDLLKAVETALGEIHPRKLGDIFLTLQKVMECVMDFNGGNDYKIPHLIKQVRRRAGNEVSTIFCDRAIFGQ